MLQHRRHTQPGSPLSAMRTVRLLDSVLVPSLTRRTDSGVTYTTLEIVVLTAPMKVRSAMVRRLALPLGCALPLNEYSSGGVKKYSSADPGQNVTVSSGNATYCEAGSGTARSGRPVISRQDSGAPITSRK